MVGVMAVFILLMSSISTLEPGVRFPPESHPKIWVPSGKLT